jgi:hypothetical protein
MRHKLLNIAVEFWMTPDWSTKNDKFKSGSYPTEYRQKDIKQQVLNPAVIRIGTTKGHKQIKFLNPE